MVEKVVVMNCHVQQKVKVGKTGMLLACAEVVKGHTLWHMYTANYVKLQYSYKKRTFWGTVTCVPV